MSKPSLRVALPEVRGVRCWFLATGRPQQLILRRCDGGKHLAGSSWAPQALLSPPAARRQRRAGLSPFAIKHPAIPPSLDLVPHLCCRSRPAWRPCSLASAWSRQSRRAAATPRAGAATGPFGRSFRPVARRRLDAAPSAASLPCHTVQGCRASEASCKRPSPPPQVLPRLHHPRGGGVGGAGPHAAARRQQERARERQPHCPRRHGCQVRDLAAAEGCAARGGGQGGRALVGAAWAVWVLRDRGLGALRAPCSGRQGEAMLSAARTWVLASFCSPQPQQRAWHDARRPRLAAAAALPCPPRSRRSARA